MTYSSSPMSIPGAFTFDQNHDDVSPPQSRGAKSHFFQPPHTPSASSSMHLARSTISAFSIDSERPTGTGRKRTRNDYSADSSEKQTPRSREHWPGGGFDSLSSSILIDTESPMPLANTRYRLAGGMDTPSAAAAAAQDAEDDSQTDIGYRRRLGPADLHETYGGSTSREYNRENLEMSIASVPDLNRQSSENWSKVALDLVGGVVGKVWEFCKASAFKGFYAGGGVGYDLSRTTGTMVENDFWHDEKSMGFDGNGTFSVPFSALPSAAQSHTIKENESRESTPPRASKRRILDNGDAELGNNWIIVPPVQSAGNSTPSTRHRPPSRAVARYSTATLSSSRRTVAAVQSSSRTLSRRTTQLTPRASRVSHAGSPGQISARPASYASPRSPGAENSATLGDNGIRSSGPQTPVSAETQRWAARKRKEEREADASMRRLNKQLQDMIREGKEALGTKVEVDFGDGLVDEGFEDGFAEVTRVERPW